MVVVVVGGCQVVSGGEERGYRMEGEEEEGIEAGGAEGGEKMRRKDSIPKLRWMNGVLIVMHYKIIYRNHPKSYRSASEIHRVGNLKSILKICWNQDMACSRISWIVNFP